MAGNGVIVFMVLQVMVSVDRDMPSILVILTKGLGIPTKLTYHADQITNMRTNPGQPSNLPRATSAKRTFSHLL
jgi:hypothetical protein